jgi:hypothetical protein
VLIKVVPLVLIAWFAWHATSRLGESISTKAGSMADSMLSTIKTLSARQSPTTRSARSTCARAKPSNR